MSTSIVTDAGVGLAASPLTGVVRTLNQLIQGLTLQLGQVAEQGLVGGDAPAEPEPEPEPEAEATEDEQPETESEPAAEAEETPADGEDADAADDKED